MGWLRGAFVFIELIPLLFFLVSSTQMNTITQQTSQDEPGCQGGSCILKGPGPAGFPAEFARRTLAVSHVNFPTHRTTKAHHPALASYPSEL